MAQAAPLLLEIYVSNPGSELKKNHSETIPKNCTIAQGVSHRSSYKQKDLHVFEMLDSNAVPIKPLEMDLHVYEVLQETYSLVHEYFFTWCKPGVLTKYIAWSSPIWFDLPFIEPTKTPHLHNGALLAIQTYCLDQVWLHISSIRVSCLRPHWNTKIYHGLVELYVDQGLEEMSESQLINILRSSPKLQVFHFKIPLCGLAGDENPNPVYLEDLQELNLMIQDDVDESSVAHILQRIAPGSKPHQLSLADTPGEVEEFCSRANVTRLYVWCPDNLNPILAQCRRSETLVLNGRDAGLHDLHSILEDIIGEDGLHTYQSIPPSTTQINTLYLIFHLEFVFEGIQAAVQKYSIQKLLIYYGRLSYQTDERRILSNNTRNIRAKRSTITACPVIQYYPDDFPDNYTEDELNDPNRWIHESLRS